MRMKIILPAQGTLQSSIRPLRRSLILKRNGIQLIIPTSNMQFQPVVARKIPAPIFACGPLRGKSSSAERGDIEVSVESGDERSGGTAHVGVRGSATDAVVSGGPVWGVPCSFSCQWIIQQTIEGIIELTWGPRKGVVLLLLSPFWWFDGVWSGTSGGSDGMRSRSELGPVTSGADWR